MEAAVLDDILNQHVETFEAEFDEDDYSDIQALPNARCVARGLSTVREAARHGVPTLPRDPAKLNARPEQLIEENRFNSMAGADLPDEAVSFGAAMRKRLQGNPGWTCGQVADVLMDLGYDHPERDFEVRVHQLTVALDQFRRETKRLFPTWADVLGIAQGDGWCKGERVKEEAAPVELPVEEEELTVAKIFQPYFAFSDDLFAA